MPPQEEIREVGRLTADVDPDVNDPNLFETREVLEAMDATDRWVVWTFFRAIWLHTLGPMLRTINFLTHMILAFP